MRETYIEKRFTAASLRTIDLVNGILTEYAGLGYDLSLRQLYYQLVARGYIENSQRSYKNVGNLVSDARLAGMVDWDMIKDRGRVQVHNSHWGTPADIMDSAAYSFRIDKWEAQPLRCIVLVEKQALEGVLIPVCRELDIPFMANKGYSSSSAMYELGKQLLGYSREGQNVRVLYLGDHDPSGIDMTRDVRERLMLFTECTDYEEWLQVDRLALNMDQVEQLNPPENPAKETDARFEGYVAEYGESSWELDAIEPRALADIVTDAVVALRDEDQWDEAVEREETMRDELKSMAATYRQEHNGRH
jgi:hypothetical protein